MARLLYDPLSFDCAPIFTKTYVPSVKVLSPTTYLVQLTRTYVVSAGTLQAQGAGKRVSVNLVSKHDLARGWSRDLPPALGCGH